eukprot:6315546-Amphidinium_carterae.1
MLTTPCGDAMALPFAEDWHLLKLSPFGVHRATTLLCGAVGEAQEAWTGCVNGRSLGLLPTIAAPDNSEVPDSRVNTSGPTTRIRLPRHCMDVARSMDAPGAPRNSLQRSGRWWPSLSFSLRQSGSAGRQVR